METLNTRYRFIPEGGDPLTFDIRLDPLTLEPAELPQGELPAWVALDYYRCGNCPLDPADHSRCPLARNLLPLVERMGGIQSFHRVRVEVETPDRKLYFDAAAQDGISSLMGLLIATSGCPHTFFFKPMARFHLPMASLEETLYRAASTYGLIQYFRHNIGQPCSPDFSGLLASYREMSVVNRAIATRLRRAVKQDGLVNAIVLLEAMAEALPVSLEELMVELERWMNEFDDTIPV